mmetsp:Transcript_36676/g.53729  ORF Transcript_36676/g.53729 Transcript_36676/m.53729 type:complete len:104 (-) Transcript_36676:38-349(-)
MSHPFCQHLKRYLTHSKNSKNKTEKKASCLLFQKHKTNILHETKSRNITAASFLNLYHNSSTSTTFLPHGWLKHFHFVSRHQIHTPNSSASILYPSFFSSLPF